MQAPLNPESDMDTSAATGLAARIRIVLVGTQHPGNIGSAARAIKTMGLHRLVLVAPDEWAKGAVRVKDLASREEADVPLDQLV